MFLFSSSKCQTNTPKSTPKFCDVKPEYHRGHRGGPKMKQQAGAELCQAQSSAKLRSQINQQLEWASEFNIIVCLNKLMAKKILVKEICVKKILVRKNFVENCFDQ